MKILLPLLLITQLLFISQASGQTQVNMNDGIYYTESSGTLTYSGFNLRTENGGFTYSNPASTAHPLMNNGIFFPVVDYLGRNLWLRVRHIENPDYPQTEYSPWGASTNSGHLFGGWNGFFYQFDIYKDINQTGTRGNILNGLFNTSIRITSEETLSNAETVDFKIINNTLTTAYWLLESINFTGNNPASNPMWSVPGGIGSPSNFPEGNKNIRAISPAVFSEFILNANTLSQFTFGYKYIKLSSFDGYQGITLKVGIEPTITICDPAPEAPVSVTTNDPDNEICQGNSITLTANDAVLTPGAVYQWYDGGCGTGTLLGNSSTLTVTPSGGVHQYFARVKDNCGNYTACVASPLLTVTALPTVSIQMSGGSGNICTNGSDFGFFAIGANGDANPVYQWRKNGADIGGEEQQFYITSNLAEGDQISCSFRRGDNYCGTAFSNIITVADKTPTISISSNVSGTICAGTNVTFTANTTNAGSSPVYQWKLNGNNVGGNSQIYSNSTLLNNDAVTCSVNNGCKSATSSSINMSVNQLPSSVTISMFQNQSTTICQGGYATFEAVGSNLGGLYSFRWKKNGVTVQTNLNSTFNTSFYQTNNLNNNDVITCEMASSVACTLPAISNEITMTVNPENNASVNIAITGGTNPNCSGGSLTFTATPTNGGATPTYEWHRIAFFPAFNTVVGTNSPTLTLQNPEHGDTYYCDMTSSTVCSNPLVASSNSITVKMQTTFSGYIYGSNGSTANASVCANETLNFGAISYNNVPTSSGSSGFTNNSPTYQWKLNGIPVGTNASTYSKTGFVNGDIITCDVASTEPCSTPAMLTLSFAVAVYDVSSATLSVDGPTEVCSGTLPTYTAIVANAGPSPSYQWKKNGLDVGTNQNSYTPDAIAVNDVITCVLTTDPLCAASLTVPANNSITVTTIIPSVVPTISISASYPLTSHSNTFTATITNGGSFPGYNWYKNGNYASNGSSTYTDNALSVGDVITCEVGSSATCAIPSSVTSNSLTVIAPPSYCTPSSNQGNQPCDYVWLTNVQMGTSTTSLNKSTVCDGYYSNFTATDTLKAAAGETVIYDIGSGGSSNWSHRQAVYIDFNNDKDFDDAGETVVDTYSGANINNTGTFILPSPLAKGSYRMRVIAANDIDFSPCLTNGGEAEDYTLQIGYCIPHTTFNATPCQSFYLANVTIGTGINNSTGCDGFYSDFSASQIVSAAAGQTLTYSLTQGSVDAQNWGSSANVYIDYNNDGDFTDAGELVASNISLVYSDAPATGSFTLTQLLNYGSYRIRVVNSSTPDNTCEIDNGETEDYTLLIAEPAYCIPVISQPCDMWLSQVNIGSNANNLPQPIVCTAGGYTDYTAAPSTTAAPGSAVSFSIVGGSNISQPWQYADIFVDFNNDGDFDDSGERVVQDFSFYADLAYTGTFNIPEDQPYGYYRMRVKCYNYNSNVDTYSGPCGDNTNGAVQDYRLIVNCVPNGSNVGVQGNNVDIADGDNTPDLADFTDFGNVELNASFSRTFTIINTGTGPLQITGNPTLSGGNQFFFSILNYPTSNLLQPNESTSFTVQVNMPSWAYNYPVSAVVHVPTDNCDKKDYDFAIGATGVPPPCTPHSWTSAANNGNWNDASNWCDGVVPTATDNVIIQTGNTPYPSLSNNASILNIEIQNGASVNIGNQTLTINGTVTGTGTLSVTPSSTIETNTSTTLLFTPGSNTIKNLTVNAGTTTLGNTLNITAGTALPNSSGTVTVIPGAVLASNGNLTFKSNEFGTARLAQGSDAGNFVTGNATIERYIPNNNFRSWRLLSVPTHSSGQTIRQAWQEGVSNPLPQQNNLPGYGTQITGTGNLATAQAAGFDNVAANAGMLFWNVNAWSPVTSTNTAIDNKKAYFLFVRGERSKGTSGATSNSSATTLRTAGSLYTGNQSTTVPANSFTLVPNLYASAIDFTGLTRTGVSNLFYIWDSKKLNGSSLGVYQTFSATNSFNCMVSGGSYVLGQPNTLIESGQAFFVQGNSTGGNIVLHESSKREGSTGLGFRPSPSALSKLETRLYEADGTTMRDAATMVFSNEYSERVEGEDAPKMGNPGENIAFETQNRILSVEGRKPIMHEEVAQLRMWNLKNQTYTLEMAPQRMASAGLEAVIEDDYLKTSTPVDLNKNTLIQFSINTNDGSRAPNRFRIVFRKAKTPLAENKPGFVIAPNPVTGNSIGLQLIHQPAGKYVMKIINAAGQLVSLHTVNHAGGTAIQQIQLRNGMGNGYYVAEITMPGGQSKEVFNLILNRK